MATSQTPEYTVEELVEAKRGYLFDLLAQLADMASECGERGTSLILRGLVEDHRRNGSDEAVALAGSS